MAEVEGSRKLKRIVASRTDPVIPDKLYFRIGEVARLLGVETYVLRFWENEFTQLRPTKGASGQRLYRRRDVEMAHRIKCLLYNERYTIPGARDLLRSEVRSRQPELPLGPPPSTSPSGKKLRHVHAELKEIANLLARPLPSSRRLVLVKGEQRSPEHKGLHIAKRKCDGDTAVPPTEF